MPENEREQKYPFLLVFLQFCGLRGTSKHSSLADVHSAIYYPKPLISFDIVDIFSLVVLGRVYLTANTPFIAKLLSHSVLTLTGRRSCAAATCSIASSSLCPFRSNNSTHWPDQYSLTAAPWLSDLAYASGSTR